MRLTKLFSDFFQSERTGGFLLIGATLISLLITNSTWGTAYSTFWDQSWNGHTITQWLNDGLMSVFFLLVGLELEREVYAGELSTLRQAMLPTLCALGGVLVPAGIYLSMNLGGATADGAGIPMATDIAFAVGILSLLGNRVPTSLKVFITALAVIDDLCAILVIALFYTEQIHTWFLLYAAGIFSILLLLNRLRVHKAWPYLIGGIGLWYCLLHSGVHATISGVLLAFAIPFGDGSSNTISYKIQHALHKPVAFLILPLFALANTCIVFEPDWSAGLTTAAGLGIFIGLVFGKPVGILLFAFMGVKSRICSLPNDLGWKHVLGAGILAGIGFTMSIFITLLAFSDQTHITIAKMSILFASLAASIAGLLFLSTILDKQSPSLSDSEVIEP
jgi:NhaA family Na+:H+ antiporter